MTSFKLLSLFAATCLTACAVVSRSGADPASIHAIQDVTVFDNNKGVAIPAQTVIVVSDGIDWKMSAMPN